MKLLISFLFCLYVLVNTSFCLAENLTARYTVSTSGISIGVLLWELQKNKNEYSLVVKLNNKGFFSKLLKFQGEYNVKGLIKNDEFFPINYYQSWITKKKDREVQIVFKNQKILELTQTPAEKEYSRIGIELISGYSDPLTSFLNLLAGKNKSKTIDGRRTYTLSLSGYYEDQNKKTYTVEDYINIWADHKRNSLEEITIIQSSKNFIPDEISIIFDGRVFKIKKY